MRDALGLLAAYEGSANVRAFLRSIRTGETSQDDQAYKWLFGSTIKNPKLFDSFADHPRVRTFEAYDGQFIKNGKLDYTTAAGAYQIVESTWDPAAKRLGLKDFSPRNQDICALSLIDEKGALDDVIAGRFGEAMNKVRKIWASLPGAGYGQPTVAYTKLLQVYEQYGGTTESSPAPQQEKEMLPFVAAAIPALVQAVPELIKMFGSGGEISERNAKAAEVVVGIAKEAIGAKNEQELIETIQKDPSAAAQVRTAVQDNWFQIVEVGGGLQAARESNLKVQGDRGFWANPAIWVSAALLIFPMMLLVDVFYVHPTSEFYSENIRTQIVTAVLAVIMMVGAYWLGTTSESAKRNSEQMK